MRIIVLGAGVVGVTTSWYLARGGHDVTIVDRQPGAGLETSFANAGEISPGYASPWAMPGLLGRALHWMTMTHPPLIIRPAYDPAMFRWAITLLGNCTQSKYRANKEQMVRLATYSRDSLNALSEGTGIAYDEGRGGTLQVFRKQKQVDSAAKDVAVLRELGMPFEVLDRAGCEAVEPGLRSAQCAIAGGLRLPGDQTGDCHKFTVELAKLAETEGVRAHYRCTVHEILVRNDRVTSIRTSDGEMEADGFVVALGVHSVGLMRPLGIYLPVYPIKGYSITVPIVSETKAPHSTLMDETFKIAITRLGNRIRVGGMAEMSGYGDTVPTERRAALLHSLQDLFPGAGDCQDAKLWMGMRPMTPDGLPLICRTKFGNLFLNTGHGTLGWTMACGSARLLVDIMSGTSRYADESNCALTRFGFDNHSLRSIFAACK